VKTQQYQCREPRLAEHLKDVDNLQLWSHDKENFTTTMPKQIWQAPDGQLFETEEECAQYESENKILRLFYDDEGCLRQSEEEQELRKVQLTLRVNEAFGKKSYGLRSTLEWLLLAAKDRDHLFSSAPFLVEVAKWVERVAKEEAVKMK